MSSTLSPEAAPSTNFTRAPPAGRFAKGNPGGPRQSVRVARWRPCTAIHQRRPASRDIAGDSGCPVAQCERRPSAGHQVPVRVCHRQAAATRCRSRCLSTPGDATLPADVLPPERAAGDAVPGNCRCRSCCNCYTSRRPATKPKPSTTHRKPSLPRMGNGRNELNRRHRSQPSTASTARSPSRQQTALTGLKPRGGWGTRTVS